MVKYTSKSELITQNWGSVIGLGESDRGHEWDCGFGRVRGGTKTEGMVELKPESQIESNLRLEVIWALNWAGDDARSQVGGLRLRKGVVLEGFGEVYRVSKSRVSRGGAGPDTG